MQQLVTVSVDGFRGINWLSVSNPEAASFTLKISKTEINDLKKDLVLYFSSGMILILNKYRYSDPNLRIPK
jgi:hypothetical protein